ncbi:MAG: hypothetical protein WD770_09045 [Actinomycetota bacterium]
MFRYQPHAVNVCYYEGRPPEDALVAPYQMPCSVVPFPAGNSSPDQSLVGGGVGPGKVYTSLTSWYSLPPGTHSLGGYPNTAGPVIQAHIQQLWLEFTF